MRLSLTLSYDGSNYFGWQSQDNLSSVQSTLEKALSKIADHPVRVVCAGRTDRGVHAVGQVVHFETPVNRDLYNWVLGTNTYLPADIRVQAATLVNDDFHARFSAVARRYRYVIYNHRVPSALLRTQSTCFHLPLDETRMRAAAEYLIGEHDFTSYRAVGCQAKSPVRTVQELSVHRQNQFIFIDIKANAFLHHMVRNIAGVLMTVGVGKREPVWAHEILQAKDRRVGDITALPHGLYFMQAYYPEVFLLPKPVDETFFCL